MEIGAALSALSNAMTLAKTLRGIEQNYDLASVRAQMAEIYDALADARIALADAKGVIADRDLLIGELRGGPMPGEPCPYCGERAMRMTAQHMHGQWEVWTCGKCEKKRDIRHDKPGPGKPVSKLR